MVMLRAAAVIGIAIATGCGRDRGRAALGRAGEDSVVAPPIAEVEVLIDVPARVTAGEEVPIAATLVNRGRDSVRLTLPPGPRAPEEIVVATDAGAVVWHSAAHDSSGAATRTVVLAPGEIRGSGVGWDQRDDGGNPVPAASYRVRAILRQPPRAAVSAWKPLVVAPH